MAFILGVLPLAVATGAGAASQRAIGTGVAGGMLSASVLGIIFVPVFYVGVLSLVKRLRGGDRERTNRVPVDASAE
jgi:multidrug efflux pump